MPLYEYRCRQCEESFEILQRIGAGAEGLVCPKCGASKLSKQVSTFAASSSGASTSTAPAVAPGCGSGFT